MFGKLKDKLKGWFQTSKEKIEEDAEVVKTEEEAEKSTKEEEEEEPVKETEKPNKSEKTKPSPVKDTKTKDEPLSKKEHEKIARKADKLIEEAKKQPPAIIPTEYNELKKQTLPDLKKVENEVETITKQVKQAEEKEKQKKKEKKEVEKFEEELEKAKQENIPEAPTKFEVSKQKFEPDVEGIKEQEEDEEEKPKASIFSRMKSSLSYKITNQEFDEIFDDLEMLLLENNVALEAVESIKSNLSKKLIGREIKKQELEKEIKTELKNTLNELLIEPDNPLEAVKLKPEKPFVILFFGINGTGKTTSIAKVTHFLKQAGFTVALAAGDTFRAASIEQISEHATKLNVPLIKHDYNADPAAVGFDAIKYAKKHKIDVVLIDTAGRMHTKANLMEEMKKIERVTKPDLKFFVAESIAGNDATEQAKTFHEAIEIDGAILSKADIDEKGGTIISISHATNKPIFFLGTGQNYEDLELFNKQKFIENLGL
jgi:fused signal recognition particle receptor